MTQGVQEDGTWETVAWPFVKRVIGGIKSYFEVPLWIRAVLVVEIDLMHGGEVSGLLWKVPPVRSNVVLLEMCLCSFLLSLLAWQLGRAGKQGINCVAIVCSGLNRAVGVLSCQTQNFPPGKGAAEWLWHRPLGSNLPMANSLSFLAHLVSLVHGKGLCCVEMAYVAMTLYLVFSFCQFCQIPRHSSSEGWIIMLLL